MTDLMLVLDAFKIRALRKEKGWTQKELSLRSGVALGALGYIEKAKTPEEAADLDIRLSTLNKLAVALDITPSALINDILWGRN